MVKRSKAERVASAGARVGGRGIGAALSSPFGLGALGVGALLVGLFIFRDRISEFFNRLPSQIAGGLGDININLPSIELPSITFPELPSLPSLDFLGDIFGGGVRDISGETAPTAEGEIVTFGKDTTFDPSTGIIEGAPPTITGTGATQFGLLRPKVFDTLTQLVGLSPAQAFAELKEATTLEDLSAILERFNPPFKAISGTLDPVFQPDQPSQVFGFDDTVLNLLGTDQEFKGGGVGFQGGVINPTPITTFGQVIALFPTITASQAADFLAEFSGILPEAALMQGFDIINITGDPSQPIIDQPSSLGTEGISPEELFKFLFPTIISNF